MTEEAMVRERIGEWAKKVNEEPILLSLLYDVDLLPEQIVTFRGLQSMAAVVVAFQEGYKKV